MKLEKQEQERLESIITNYKAVYDKIDKKQVQIKQLEEEVKTLLKELADNRKVEEQFGQELEAKYGKGKFNILIREYELDK